MMTNQSRLAESSEVRAESSTARWRHITIGLVGYFIPVVLLALGIKALLESLNVGAGPAPLLAIIAVSLLIVVWQERCRGFSYRTYRRYH